MLIDPEVSINIVSLQFDNLSPSSSLKQTKSCIYLLLERHTSPVTQGIHILHHS